MENTESKEKNRKNYTQYTRYNGFIEEVNNALSSIDSKDCFETLTNYAAKTSEENPVPFSYFLYSCCDNEKYLSERQKTELKDIAIAQYKVFAEKLTKKGKQETAQYKVFAEKLTKKGKQETGNSFSEEFVENCIDFFYFHLVFGYVWKETEKPKSNFIVFLRSILGKENAPGFITKHLLNNLVFLKNKGLINNSIFFDFILEIIDDHNTYHPTEYINKFSENKNFIKINLEPGQTYLNKIYNKCYQTLKYDVLYSVALMVNNISFQSFGIDSAGFLKDYKNNYRKNNRSKHFPYFVLCFISLNKDEDFFWFKKLIDYIKFKLHEFDEDIEEYSLSWVSFVFLCTIFNKKPELINDIDYVPEITEALKYYNKTKIVNISLDKNFNKKFVFDAFLALYKMQNSDLNTICKFIDLLGINNNYLYVPKNSNNNGNTKYFRYEEGGDFLKKLVDNSKRNDTFSNEKLLKAYFNSSLNSMTVLSSLAENINYSSIKTTQNNNMNYYQIDHLFEDFYFYGFYRPLENNKTQVVSFEFRNDVPIFYLSNRNDVRNTEFKVLRFSFYQIRKYQDNNYRFYVKGEKISNPRDIDFGKRPYDHNGRFPFYRNKLVTVENRPLSVKLKMLYEDLEDGFYVRKLKDPKHDDSVDDFVEKVLKKIGYKKETLSGLSIDERIACSYYFIKIAVLLCTPVNRKYNTIEYGNHLYGVKQKNSQTKFLFSYLDDISQYLDDIVTNIDVDKIDHVSQFYAFKKECNKPYNQEKLNNLKNIIIPYIKSKSGIKKLYTETIIKYLMPVEKVISPIIEDTTRSLKGLGMFSIKGILKGLEEVDGHGYYLADFEYLVNGEDVKIKIIQDSFDNNGGLTFKYEEEGAPKEVVVRVGELQRIRLTNYDYENKIVIGKFWGD